jgi:RNA polymerase sigma factor (sigma-70 family)
VRKTTTPIASGERAIAELFRERFEPMVRLATLLTGSVQTAEELVMDAFTRLAPRIDELDQPAAYLRTAVVNATRSHHRRLRTARAHPVAGEATVVEPEIDELWQRLDQLRPDERACVVLRFYEDLPLTDIADQLDLPLGTVKSHLHRAIATLRTLLAEELAAESTEEDR